MQITVAGEQKTYDDGITVKQLIDAENLDNPLYVTVSINDEFVRNNAFDTTVLKDGDVVEFMYFMGGGAR